MRRAGLAVVLAAFLGSGCLVDIRNTSNPAPAFRDAREEAARLQGRPGPARSVNVLVYDPSDRKLVRVGLPMWLVKKAAKHAHDEDAFDVEIGADDEDGERIKKRVKRHLRIDDIDKAGLGILVEVEEEDGAQVLVWLR